eukprot:NODE_7816_length_254_cov_63.487805_g7201_i0.p3 GENE.NODE_7816_length_254_cov_63.487805_g7201_i0~~NODE_7816_length_254_cov_63.487805_g7201_i0.p3  ORF type:complete len:51 (+),score=21.85 NODE_7816_length_254_cov_63.487805_g7201_i0:33-155(+)
MGVGGSSSASQDVDLGGMGGLGGLGGLSSSGPISATAAMA